MPHEQTGTCPSCHSDATWPLFIDVHGDSGNGADPVEVLCRSCKTDMSFWWSVQDFLSFDSIEDDADAIKAWEAVHLKDQLNEEYDIATQLMICCDLPAHECKCRNPVTWHMAVSVVESTPLRSLDGLYDWHTNGVDEDDGQPACTSCKFMCTAQCTPLRDSLYELTIMDQRISMLEGALIACNYWRPDVEEEYATFSLDDLD